MLTLTISVLPSCSTTMERKVSNKSSMNSRNIASEPLLCGDPKVCTQLLPDLFKRVASLEKIQADTPTVNTDYTTVKDYLHEKYNIYLTNIVNGFGNGNATEYAKELPACIDAFYKYQTEHNQAFTIKAIQFLRERGEYNSYYPLEGGFRIAGSITATNCYEYLVSHF